MKHLPGLTISKAPKQSRIFLEDWLLEWQLQQPVNGYKYDDESIPDGTITKEQITKLKGLVNPFDMNISINQIRLLSSAIVPNSNRPYYVAIIKQWDHGMILVAPYAPFSVPATTGELLTGRDHFSLATLELWNARTVPGFLLTQSWLVDELTQAECEEAFAVFANITSGKELPKNLIERAGLPIVNPKDPRLEYQKLEIELLTPLQNKIMQVEQFKASLEKHNNIIHFADFAEQQIKLPMAANDGDREESKCIIMNKTIRELLNEEFIAAVDGEGFVIKSCNFETLNPEYQDVQLLQWQLSSEHNIDGTEYVFAFDRVNKSLIGTGTVIIDGDGNYINLDTIHYSTIQRTIDKETDIVLVIVKL